MTERTPVRSRLPWCYTQHRADAECAECEHSVACSRARSANLIRLTVRQAADAAVVRYLKERGEAPPTVTEMMDLAIKYSGTNENAIHAWIASEKWNQAFRVVSAVCARAGWDARTYVRAIAETVGAYAVRKGWALKTGMFVGKTACERFERWAERNRKIHGDEKKDRRSDQAREELLAGECCFAERLVLSRVVTVEDAEAFARGPFPGWCLSKTEGRDDVRLPALAAALASVDPVLPHRVLAPTECWSWATVREELHDLLLLPEREDDDEEVLELSPELGEVL